MRNSAKNGVPDAAAARTMLRARADGCGTSVGRAVRAARPRGARDLCFTTFSQVAVLRKKFALRSSIRAQETWPGGQSDRPRGHYPRRGRARAAASPWRHRTRAELSSALSSGTQTFEVRKFERSALWTFALRKSQQPERSLRRQNSPRRARNVFVV